MGLEMEDKIIAYLTGELPEAERQDLENLLATSAEWAKVKVEYTRLLEGIRQPVGEVPSGKLRNRWETFLEAEIQARDMEKYRPTGWFNLHKWNIAAAIALVVIGSGFGILWRTHQTQKAEMAALRQEMAETQKMLVLSMLEQNSASERIRALNMSLEDVQADRQVLEAFMQALNADNSVNVRIKAAEALASFGKDPYALKALIHGLEAQEDPAVQITIIDLLVGLRAKNATGAFERLVRQDNVLDIVKDKATEGIKALL